jgi:hypothetical protein
MYYSNPNCGDQQNATGVWDTEYKMVQHLEAQAVSRNGQNTPEAQ